MSATPNILLALTPAALIRCTGWFGVLLLVLCMCQRPRAYACRMQIFALDCIIYREKLRSLFRAAYRRLLCGLLFLIKRLDLHLDQLRHWFRRFHKCDDAKPNEKGQAQPPDPKKGMKP